MNSFRFARAAVRARPMAMMQAVQRRGYAEAVPDKVRRRTLDAIPSNPTNLLTEFEPQIKLSLALPHQVCIRPIRAAYRPSSATQLSPRAAPCEKYPENPY